MALKTSRFARLNKIVGLGAAVVGKSIQGALTAKSQLDTRIAQAKAIALALSELKGASMKLGQMLSIQGEAFLPPEVAEVLSLLQNTAPAFSGEEMEQKVKDELKENFAQISHFEKTALAAASIGQVHRGTLHSGAEVVFKIQYPGIAQAIDSEISLLKTLLIPIFRAYAKNMEVDHIVEEVRDVLKQEVNYLAEAKYLHFFGDKLKNDPRFVVPTSYFALTTSQVLTMSYEKGQSFKDFCRGSVSQEVRNSLGLSTYELLMDEIFKFRTVQTDPNFGNYLIRPYENSYQTVLLDFGSCRTYDTEFVEGYRLFLRAAARNDRAAILEQSYKMKLLDENESEAAKEIFFVLCQTAIQPFISQTPFDFQDLDFPKKLNRMSVELMRALKVLPAPRQLIFLNRKLGGVYNYCRALKVSASFRPVLEKALDF